MSVQVMNCSICHVCEPCYHACCLVVYVCRSCLTNSQLLADYPECYQCNRPLEIVYNSLANKLVFNDESNWNTSRPFPSNNFRPPSTNLNQNHIRNHFNSHQSTQEVEEEFEFAQTLQKKQSQLRKVTNNLTFQTKNHSNQYQHSTFHPQGINHSFAQNMPFSPKINPGNPSFDQRNNFGNGQFNGKNNNFCANEGNFGEGQYNSNLGFQHQNEMTMKNHYNQGNGFNQNGGFTQNIRRSKPSNQPNNFQPNNFQPNNFQPNNFQPNNFQPNNFQPNNFQHNSFSGNQQYQNEPQMNGPAQNRRTNQFSMWNQQTGEKMQQSNFGQQNRGNAYQNQFQANGCFQSSNNSFQNGHSYERATKSVGKVQQVKRVNNFNGNSGSFRIENHANHEPSEKEQSPTFGTELNNNEEGFSGAMVPYGNQGNNGREAMEIEQESMQRAIKKTKSYDSLVTLGRREDSSD